MVYNVESQCNTSFYRCIDPIENFKIKVILEPIINSCIPPQFDKNKPKYSSASSIEGIDKLDADKEEYVFSWQEKLFNKEEIRKYSNKTDNKAKFSEKYFKNLAAASKKEKQFPQKLFSYVDVDNYSADESKCKKSFISRSSNTFNLYGQLKKSLGNIPKTKIINYSPSNEFKNQTHALNRNIQKMFLMVDLSSNLKEEKQECLQEKYLILCALSYNYVTKLLEIVPSFSQNPYIINCNNQDKKPAFYYWLQNASSDIPKESLNKEIKMMTKVFDHQEELKNLQIGTEFFIGKPNFLYVTLLGEIVSAEDFEFDFLHIYYNVKLPSGWENCDNNNNILGVTQTSSQNSQGILYFSHLFEMNFFVNIESFKDSFLSFPQIFFEVISLDKYSRYRHEGYTYVSIPNNSGMYNFSLQCWRATDNTINSKLKRFFIGGGPELDDIAYVGLGNTQNAEVSSRYGFVTIPSGKVNLKLSIIHQCDTLKSKKFGQQIIEKSSNKKGTDSLLSSVNIVLEAFRQARARMIEVKKKLEVETNNDYQNNDDPSRS